MFEIGNSLREARTRRQIEFAQAEQATKIRGKYLRALEEEQFGILPSQTYIKGFLRTYADYLGLDGQLYVDEYNSRFVVGDDWARPQRAQASEHADHRVQRNVVLVALGIVVVLTVIVISAWKTSGSGHAAVHTPKKVATPQKQAVTGAYLQISAAHGPSKVIVHRTGSTGRILFEGTLERGETQGFNGTRFWLNISAPENLVMKVGGKRVHLGGYRPWVVTVSATGWHSHPA